VMADDELRVRASMENDLSRELENVREDVEDVGDEMDRVNRKSVDTSRGISRLGTGVGKLTRLLSSGLVLGLKAAAVGLAALGAAAVLGLGKVISLATDAGETLSKFNTVFGQNRRVMERWVQGMHRQFGIATKDLRDATSTFGVFGQAAGIAEKDLPKFSQSLAKAGLDLASFYNVSPEDAFLALRSGLAGEAEPLRQFGIFLSDATMKAKASQMGLRGELSESQKVMVRQQLILAGLGKAHNDLDRTSDSLANQWRALKGRAKELGTGIGTGLVPIAEVLVRTLNQRLAPVIERVSRLAPKLAEAFRDGDLSGAIDIIDRMAGSGGRLAARLNRLHELGMKIGRVMTDDRGKLAAFRDEFPKLAPYIDKVVEVGSDLWRIISKGLAPAFGDAAAIVPDLLQPLSLLDDVLGFVADNAETLRPLITALITGFIAYKGVVMAVRVAEAVALVTRNLLAVATGRLAAQEAIANVSTGALAGSTGVLNAVMAINPIVLVVAALVALAAGLVIAWRKSETFRRIVAGALNFVASVAGDVIGFLIDGFRTFLKVWITVAGGIVDAAASAFGWVPGIGGKIKDFRDEFHRTTDGILANLQRQSDRFHGWGEKAKSETDKVKRGFQGLSGAIDTVSQSIGDVFDQAAGVVRPPKNTGRGAVPTGDTATPRGGAGTMANTLGLHGLVDSMTPGARTITSSWRPWGSSGDHQRMVALDLVGPNLNAYAANLRSIGGWAEHHGTGKGRHLHGVYPAGDTATTRARRPAAVAAGGGDVHFDALVAVYGDVNGADLDELEGVAVRAYRRLKRDEEER
jgi:hypothetical protein